MAHQAPLPYADPAVNAAFFDIDGTLTTGGDIWRPLVSSPDVMRHRKAWLYGTVIPHYLLSKTGVVGQAAFRDRWVRVMAWLMKGWSETKAQALYEQIIHQKLLPNLRTDVIEIVREHSERGHYVVLVSTMFEGIVNGLAHRVGAQAGLGSQVEMRNGQCTGRIAGETCSGKRKVSFSSAHLAAERPDLSLVNSAAYADSRSDIVFLEGLGHPVAVYPDDAMRQAAEQNGWRIYEGA